MLVHVSKSCCSLSQSHFPVKRSKIFNFMVKRNYEFNFPQGRDLTFSGISSSPNGDGRYPLIGTQMLVHVSKSCCSLSQSHFPVKQLKIFNFMVRRNHEFYCPQGRDLTFSGINRSSNGDSWQPLIGTQMLVHVTTSCQI